MSYIFSDQLSKLSSLIGDPNSTTDDMFTLATRKKEINRGELQFAVDAQDIREYATGTVSGSQIAVPSDWLATYQLIVGNYNVSNSREIALSDWERYQNWNGTPPYFYFWEFSGTRYIKFLGTAVNGETYQLFYFKKPTTELSADADVSIHPEEYREAPVYYAAAQLLRQIGKEQEAQIYLGVYESLVQRARVLTEKTAVNKEYALPDMGDSDASFTDIQGRGWIG